MLWWNIYMVKFQCFPGMKQWSIDTIVTLCYIEIHAVQNHQLQDDYQSIPNIPGYQFLSKSLVLKNSCCQFVLLKVTITRHVRITIQDKRRSACGYAVHRFRFVHLEMVILLRILCINIVAIKLRIIFFFYQEIERWTTIVYIHIFIFISLLKKIF